MLAEEKVPLEQRVLVLEGRLSEELPIRGLPDTSKHSECFFCQYAYADLPLPKLFEVVFPLNDPALVEVVSVRIEAATQQFDVPDTQIPHGWKMLCWLGTSSGASKHLRALPSVSGWFESRMKVGLASRESWQAFTKKMANQRVQPTAPSGRG